MPEDNKLGGALAWAGSVAIFAVFLAGNFRTQSAVDRFARTVAHQITPPESSVI